ncbi:Cytochrome P450 [Mycena indigotica]|uniref:Cytochrome P450 n=1 Tax=Mycena indigotica TaxID=2126181 RepID=A0A8H6T2R8_9AGAR|nr:Cytochrome P450 [Mycena indigotica]KAF7309908.1 Cytochrome P450 [Mycena indigotica]
MTQSLPLSPFTVSLVIAVLWLIVKLTNGLNRRRGTAGTTIRGPKNDSFIFGMTRRIVKAADTGLLFQEWAEEYGPVYQIAAPLGAKRLVLCDPKAVNHFYSMERSVYVKTQLGRNVIANLVCSPSLYVPISCPTDCSLVVVYSGLKETVTNGNQRKALTPAFSNAAIRRLTDVFYDSAYKLKGHWDRTLDESTSGEGAVIDVEHWVNRVALDSIGIAGFAHDFGTLDGKYSAVAAAFDGLSFDGGLITNLLFLLGLRLPFLARLPSQRNRITRNLRLTMSEIADQLLEKTRKEKKTHITDETMDRSVIGLLLKAESDDAELHMDPVEVLAQMAIHSLQIVNIALIVFSECFALGRLRDHINLTWALIELARQPQKQAQLREELMKFGSSDPTWDQLVSGLSYLDAVVLETLRLHPPLAETTRVADVDDILPISEPITLPDGEVVDSIVVAKGTLVTASIRCMNQSERFWGPDAKEFKPERWLTLETDPLRAKEITGHRHLITFSEGPRVCLGKQFALAEFKAVLVVLIRNFMYAFPGGPETEIAAHKSIIPRPKVAGQPGANVPMLVRRVD